MTHLALLKPTPLKRIRQLAQTRRGYVAVPFLGANAAGLLPLRRGSVLITRVTLQDVKEGLVSPREVLRYLRAGVEVHSCSNLHAKVYVFGTRAIVGSANVSARSMRLVEAAIETADRAVVAQAREFVDELRRDPVSIEFAKSLLRHYREDRVGGWSEARQRMAAPRSTKTMAQHSRMWVVPLVHTEWPDAAKEAAAARRPAAQRAIADKRRSRLDEFNWNGSWNRLIVGDRVVQRFDLRRGFEFEPPARVVMIAPYRDGRSAVVFVERRKRLRLISSTDLRAQLKRHARDFCGRTSSLRLVRSGEAAELVVGLWPTLAAD